MKKRSKGRSKQKKMKREHEISLMVFGALAICLILLFSLNFNLPFEPSQNHETTKTIVIFRWFGFANKVLVDNDKDFSSPKIISSSPGKSYAITELEPGEYYWKTNGISPIQGFVIESEVAIEIKNDTVKNEGNVPALIELFKNFSLTAQAILDVNQELKLNENEINETNKTEKAIASQHENE